MTSPAMLPRRVVVIGAARSGTKVLRDAMARATGAGAVPYDIGYVWRAAEPGRPDDVLDPGRLTPSVQGFIADFVDSYAAGSPPTVIEKTVGNTLRVPYVAAALPGACFVHVVRDGIDVAESTRRQWRAAPDYRYLVAKSRHFPLRLLPGYGRRYVGSLLRRRIAGDGRVGSWGPRYPGIDVDLRDEDLLAVCARQWRESVTRARHDLATTSAIVTEVRYEAMVREPMSELARICASLGLETSSSALEAATALVQPGLAGRGRRSLTTEELARVDDEVGPLLDELGYRRPLREEVGE